MGAGRPTKLTKDVQDKICSALRAGNFRTVAAQWAGVPLRTFYEWMGRGKEEPDRPEAKFRQAVIEAEKAAEVRAVGLIMSAAQSDPKHAEWWLSHRWPERWADQERKRIRAEIKVTHRLHEQGGVAKLSREEVDKRLALLDSLAPLDS